MENIGNLTWEQHKKLAAALFPKGYVLNERGTLACGLFNNFFPMELTHNGGKSWNMIIFYVLEGLDYDYRDLLFDARKLIDNCGLDCKFDNVKTEYDSEMHYLDIYFDVYPEGKPEE